MSLSFSRFNFLSSLLAGTATVAALVVTQSAVIAAKSPQKIAQMAIPMTVQINPQKGGGGSGVIIKKQGNSYDVLTSIHVVDKRLGLSIRTHDGKTYPPTNIQKLGTTESSDLAIVTFSSPVTYPVAKLANSDQAVIGSQVFVFGYPALDGKSNAARDFEFSPGFVTSRPSKGAPKGFEPYTMRYNAVTKGGMSGGPVFDVDGRVVGIHGFGGQEAEAGGGSPQKTGFNAAVPIKTYETLRQVAQRVPNVEVDNTPSTDKPSERLTNPKSAADFVAKGGVEHEQGDKSQAINAYTQAINLDPNYADAYYQRANARYDQGDKQGALEDYTQAISRNPDYANAYFQRGVIRFNQGDKQGAVADLDRYISLFPDDVDAYYNRGVIRRNLQDAQGTFEDFDKLVSLAPNDARAYYNRGLARAGLQDRQGTLEDFNQAISLNPNWIVAYNTRALHRRRMGDREGAIADLTEVLRLEPKNAVAYFNRGLIRRDLGERQEAIADLQSAADLFQQKSDTSNYQKALEKIQSIQASLNVPAIEPLPAVESDEPALDNSGSQLPAVDSDEPIFDAPATETEPADDSGW